jgi:hypothetical protein
LITAVLLSLDLYGAGQQLQPKPAGKPPSKAISAVGRKLTPQQKFVMDAVRLAVALEQPDPQDRLRVLAVAANVISPIDPKTAQKLRREGVRIESELVLSGQTPAVSLMASGQADCALAQNFVSNLPDSSVVAAEQSLIGVVTSCPKQTLELVAMKLDAALKKRVVAPRALMATMQGLGSKSPWSQEHFEEIFRSLPDAKDSISQAENFAAVYARTSADVDQAMAKKAGLELLDWLGQLDDGGIRSVAINITSGAMKRALGEQGFRDALSGDVVAWSAVRNAQNGAPPKIERPPLESASVLEAMKHKGADQTDRLRDLPASTRAREAAAHGFAAGTSGDKPQADKYFDMAFAAVDEVWAARRPQQNTAAIVEEVSEAAAQVDSVNALTRAQALREPAARAIAMLAVARVVGSKKITR